MKHYWLPQQLCYSACLICDLIHVNLPAPNNVRATVLSHSSVKVTWDQFPDATEYTISYSTTASDISSGSITVKGCSTTSYNFNNLEGNTPYTITVQATISDGRKSAVSSEVSIRTGKAIIMLQDFNSYNYIKRWI